MMFSIHCALDLKHTLLYNSLVLASPLPPFPAESLKGWPNLRVLSLSSCGIDNAGVFYLTAALKYCLKLKDLELNGNQFGPVGAQELAKLIKDSTYIKNVFLLRCDAMQVEGTTSLLQALSRNQSVQRMFLPDVFEHTTSPVLHLASRVVWLPDTFTEMTVDLSGKTFSKNQTAQVAIGNQILQYYFGNQVLKCCHSHAQPVVHHCKSVLCA